jgi:tetratricopeptide (TPR) repeat protein
MRKDIAEENNIWLLRAEIARRMKALESDLHPPPWADVKERLRLAKEREAERSCIRELAERIVEIEWSPVTTAMAGAILRRLRMKDRARELLNASITLEPDKNKNAQGWTAWAVLRWQDGAKSEAETLLQTLPESYHSLRALGKMFQLRGRHSEADDLFRRASLLDPCSDAPDTECDWHSFDKI